MSCQQVPRLTEDPYTFTEATSTVSATLFNPQIHRLSPIFSSGNTKSIVNQKSQISNQQRVVQQTQQIVLQQQTPQQQIVAAQQLPQQQQQQKQQNSPQKSSQLQQKQQTPSPKHQQHQQQQQQQVINKQVQLQQIQQQTSPQHQHFLTSRINGLTAVVNGIHKNAIPVVSTATLSAKVQSQLQYPTTKITAVKFLQPQSPGTTITVPQSHPLYSIAKQQQTTVSSTPLTTANLPLPPLFQRSITATTPIQHQQQQQQTTSIIQQIELNPNQKNHSNATKLLTPSVPASGAISTATAIRVTQAPPGSTFATYASPPISLGQIGNTPINVGVIRKAQIPLGKQTNPNSNNNNNNNINTTNDAKTTKISGESLLSQQQQQPPPPPPPPPITATNNETTKTVFATPAKKDIKNSVAPIKKTPKLQTNPNSRTKRSYSQTAHHEALQRIPSSASGSASTATSASGTSEWHAPDSYIFDGILPALSLVDYKKNNDYEVVPCVQKHWFDPFEMDLSITELKQLTREQRIEIRKAQLRREAMQYISTKKFHTPTGARRRLLCVAKALKKLRERDETPPPKKCCFPTCINDALAFTAYCYLHITRNADQHLFLPCTAKFSDNSQCRVPVFDISHELPLCREHAWKRDNYNRISQEQKPKKTPRKRPKPSAMTRPQKRSKKKRKQQPSLASMSSTTSLPPSIGIHDESHHHHDHDHDHDHHQQFDEQFFNDIKYEIKSEDDVNYVISQTPTQTVCNYGTTQDMLSMCENSSAYESSEDTGVGGLSETELMVGAHDVIEEIPLADTRLLEEHDLTNVLNQLPVDAFNELFTADQQNGPSEPTQEEQEDLERALEAVNNQVKSLTQMQQMIDGDTNFLGDFVDLDDQILEDTDICTEVVLRSPDDNDMETGGVIIGATANDTSGCKVVTTADLRGLVQT